MLSADFMIQVVRRGEKKKDGVSGRFFRLVLDLLDNWSWIFYEHLFAFSHAHWELENLRKMEALSIWAVVTKCPEAVRPWTVEPISFSYSEDREVQIRQLQILCLVRARFLAQGWCLHNMPSQSRKGKATFWGEGALFHKGIYPVRKKCYLVTGPSIQGFISSSCHG